MNINKIQPAFVVPKASYTTGSIYGWTGSNLSSTVTTSRDRVTISQVARDHAIAEKSFVINDMLTPKDKRLVVAATGSLNLTDGSGIHEINPLAVRIALDRSTGKLAGEVDKFYLNSIIKEQQTSDQPAIQFDTLYKALAYLDQPSTSLSTSQLIDVKLSEIKSKDVMSRTASDTEYLWANDKKLAEISAKGKSPDQLTSSELDYMQKAGGFVNTMANLSPAEKGLYDKAVASGNKDAAAGISQIAFIRTLGHTTGGSNGTTYDPINTEITASNIERYFSHSIVDPSGKAQSQFQALIQYLQKNPVNS